MVMSFAPSIGIRRPAKSTAQTTGQTLCRRSIFNFNPIRELMVDMYCMQIDISSLTSLDLASSPAPADLWLLSPSCQPYTVLNPDAKGALDPRARSFLHLVQTILPELVKLGTGVHPTRLLIENVAGFEVHLFLGSSHRLKIIDNPGTRHRLRVKSC